MPEAFQRLFQRADFTVQSLNVQAAMGPVRVPRRSQLSLLTRHFLERFFNHETASPDGDAKTRMVQIAVAAGLPPFVVAMYLWPVYHPMIVYPPHPDHIPGPPPYWVQVNHHLFFVVYAFVAMGIAAVWEWDLFFPDLLDVMVLGTLPAPERRVFVARVAAIGVFLGGFLLDANALAPVVLVPATDPPDAGRFLAGTVLADGERVVCGAAGVGPAGRAGGGGGGGAVQEDLTRRAGTGGHGAGDGHAAVSGADGRCANVAATGQRVCALVPALLVSGDGAADHRWGDGAAVVE